MTQRLIPAAQLSTTQVDAEFERIVDQLTRRGFLAGGIGAATLLGLGACNASSEGSAPASPSASTGTREIDTVKGKVEVPASPTRVVAGVYTINNILLDLGVEAIGTQDPGAEYVSPRYRGTWESTPKINAAGSAVNVEKIAAMKPDLILGPDYPWMTDLYQQLTALAPTVITSAGRWQDTVRTVAEAVDKVDVLDRLQTKYAERTEQIKAAYAEVLGRYTWDLVQGGFNSGQFWAYSPDDLAGQVLTDAGVRFASSSRKAASSKDPGDGVLAISYENISELEDADVIGYYASYDGKPNNLGPQLFAQPLWKKLPAVVAGRLVPIPDFLVGGYGDALACLDQLEAGLTKLQAA